MQAVKAQMLWLVLDIAGAYAISKKFHVLSHALHRDIYRFELRNKNVKKKKNQNLC